MDDSARHDFDPACVVACLAALSAAEKALHVDLITRFSEREESLSHPYIHLASENLLKNGLDHDASGAERDILINDEVKSLIGDGSVVIEYDVVKGKVYSVWYSETPGCYVIPGGRRTDRAGRFRTDVKNVEGYSTGKVNG